MWFLWLGRRRSLASVTSAGSKPSFAQALAPAWPCCALALAKPSAQVQLALIAALMGASVQQDIITLPPNHRQRYCQDTNSSQTQSQIQS